MKLKEKIISKYKPLIQKLGNNKFASIKKQALDIFGEKGFPTPKDEDWKYTNLKPILNIDIPNLDIAKSNIDISDIKHLFIDIDSYKIIVVDGFLNENISTVDSDKFIISPIKKAFDGENPSIVDKYFGKTAPIEHSMVALNTLSFSDGVFIHIIDNAILDKPIEIIHIYTVENTLSQPRNLIYVGKNTEVEIIESHKNIAHNRGLTNSVTEIIVGENSHYHHTKIQNDNDEANLIDNTFISQNRYSNTYINTFSLGGNLTRNNLEFHLNEEYSIANFNGLSLLNKKQHVDNFTLVKHKVSNCDSHEIYKGIYDDNSKGAFSGKIFIAENAQNSNGNQQNNNLLLSEKAEVNIKPQLEIYANDVKANHGCTVGQLDEEALFFMRSRGINEKDAKALLTYAFANESLSNVKSNKLKLNIKKCIATKLNVNLEF